MRVSRRREGAFGLVVSLFLLVVLAVAAMVLVDLGGVQRRTALLSLQTVRARHAARSGVEWGLQRIQALGGCPPTTVLSPAGGLGGFQVRVTCASSQHVESGSSSTVFEIEAEATRGAFGEPDYVRRRIRLAAHLPI